MSDLAKQYPPGQEKATAIKTGSSNDARPQPNGKELASVAVNGQEPAKGGGVTDV
jgi:hypothetical protein